MEITSGNRAAVVRLSGGSRAAVVGWSCGSRATAAQLRPAATKNIGHPHPDISLWQEGPQSNQGGGDLHKGAGARAGSSVHMT